MPNLSTHLSHAWLSLAVLSALAALVSSLSGQGIPVAWAAAGILLLALSKARVILSRYLGLSQAPGWLAGFFNVIAIWAAIMFTLYLMPLLLK